MANINTKTRRGEMLSEDRSEMTPARRKMIHDHRKKADLYGPQLPFEFGIFKPKLGFKKRDVEVMCNKCNNTTWVSDRTHAVVCRHCSTLIIVK